MFIDAHAHLIVTLDEQKLQSDLKELHFQMEKNQISYVVSNSSNPKCFPLIQHEQEYASILSAIGINRNLAKNANNHSNYMESLQKSLEEYSPHAIGETGLDYSTYFGEIHPNSQKSFLRKEIQLAREFDLPIVIHAVQSDADLVQILKDEKANDIPIQIQEIDLKPSTIKQLIDIGCYFSLSWYHFDNPDAKFIPDLIPCERVLLETDAPFAVTPLHSEMSSSPLDIPSIYDAYSQQMEIPLKDVVNLIQNNFKKMFHI